MEESFVVDEFRRVVLVELIEILEDFRLHVFDKRRVVPELIEPHFQVAPVAIAVHFQIEFDVVVAGAEAEAAHCEIRTAEDCFLHSCVGDVVHLAVKQLGVAEGFDVHLLANPVGAFSGDPLLKLVGELQAVAVQDKRLFLRLLRVEGGDESGFAEKEVQMVNPVEMFTKRVVGVNGEISGNNREPRTRVDLGLKEISDNPAFVVVPDSRAGCWIWHVSTT